MDRKTVFGLLLSSVFLLASCAPVPSAGTINVTPSITPSPATTELPVKTAVTPSPTTASLPPQVINSIQEMATLPDVISMKEIVTGIEEIDQGAISYELQYLSDGYVVVGYVAAPRDYLERPEPYPVLVANRGGQADFAAIDSYSPAKIAMQFDAIILMSQYRETRDGTGKDEFGGDDVHDVIKLMDFIELCTFADKDHMVMLGSSRGSIMTFEIIRMDERIKAAIVISGVPDLVAVYDQRDEHMKAVLVYRVGGTPDEVPEEYARRSALQWADEIDVPLLIFHTMDDTRAPIGPVDKFVSLLESLGKEVTYVRKAEGGHGWSDMEMILEFFNTYAAESNQE